MVYYEKRTPKSYKKEFLKKFVDLFSTQNIDYSEKKGKCKILEEIVNSKIYYEKNYKGLKKLFLKKKIKKQFASVKKIFKKGIEKVTKKLKAN